VQGLVEKQVMSFAKKVPEGIGDITKKKKKKKKRNRAKPIGEIVSTRPDCERTNSSGGAGIEKEERGDGNDRAKNRARERQRKRYEKNPPLIDPKGNALSSKKISDAAQKEPSEKQEKTRRHQAR